MARPRKDSNTPDVRIRMFEAFWALLEENDIRDISVGMIVREAACNRGSFYYHFEDFNAFIDACIVRELKGDGRLPMRIFVVAAGASNTKELFDDFIQNIHRLAVVMKKGGYENVRAKVLVYLQGVWQSLLCEEGEELTLESKFVITYITGGLLSVMQRFGQNVEEYSIAEGMYLSEVGGVAVHNICAAQGIPFNDALDRLREPERVTRVQIQ